MLPCVRDQVPQVLSMPLLPTFPYIIGEIDTWPRRNCHTPSDWGPDHVPVAPIARPRNRLGRGQFANHSQPREANKVLIGDWCSRNAFTPVSKNSCLGLRYNSGQ